ncbi:coiled-coil domain-containing protein [Krasilnikovia sp. MM14-A1259]|uniref:coiled-coil domain-containing protein n=1 Tax=Krasilnikovia sp. MM14-A1259 TaxID=3373539 RepID=UPI003807A856
MAATLLRRCLTAPVAMLAALAVLLLAAPHAAHADPEGGTKTLRDALESAAKGHLEATAKLDASRKRQGELRDTLKQAQADATRMQAQVEVTAGRAYKYGRATTLTVLLDSGSPDSFLDRISRLDAMAQLDGRALADYRRAVDTTKAAQQAIAREIGEQEKQVGILARKKKEAELALGSVGGGSVAGGFVSVNSPLAKPAPRNSDGSWPKESCTVNDPTTSGCITPRLLNAYQQARSAGFTHYTSCYSVRDSGEHPKGRACDFSANATTFQNVAASGGDKQYGDRLAAYFVKNASRLGVMYVIWYRQIWLPNTGWRAYSASGGPAAVHTNHVHLSVL